MFLIDPSVTAELSGKFKSPRTPTSQAIDWCCLTISGHEPRHAFGVNLLREIFIEPDQVFLRALEGFGTLLERAQLHVEVPPDT
jgi:hypothetical protein